MTGRLCTLAALGLAIAVLALPFATGGAAADSAADVQARALARVIGGGQSTPNPLSDVSKYIGHYELASPSGAPSAGAGGPPAASGFKPGQTIFTDDFKTLDPAWGSTDESSFVDGGQFHFHVAAASGATTRYSGKYLLPQVDVAVSITAASDAAVDGDAGLIVWGTAGTGAFTAFKIAPALGSFAIVSDEGDKRSAIINWQHDPAINTAPGAVNLIEAIANTSGGLFLINGNPVARIAPPATGAPAGAQIGLMAEGGGKDPGDFAFSDLVVKMAPDTPGFSVTTAPGVAPGQPIWSSDFQALDPSWGFPSSIFGVAGGKLHVDSPWGLAALNHKFGYGAFDLSADLAVTGQAAGGVAFWGDDSSDYTEFDISPSSGEFAAHRVLAGLSTNLIAPQVSSAIKTAAGDINHLEVTTQDGKAILAINGQPVGSVAPLSPNDGLVGVWGQPRTGRMVLDFSKFAVAAATASPATAPLPSPATPAPAAASQPPAATASSSAPETSTISQSTATVPTAASAAPTAPSSNTGTYTDDFGTLDPAWGKPDKFIYAANNILELHSGTNREIDLINNLHPLTLGEVEVSLLLEDGTADDAIGGIDFWAKDSDNYTLFAIDPVKGSFALYRQTTDGNTALIDWTHSDLIDTRVGNSNRLGVRLSADKAVLLINGQPVGEFATPQSMPGNLIGLDSSGGDKGPGHLGFTHLVVTPPGAAPAPPAPPTTSASASTGTTPASPAVTPAVPTSASAVGFTDDFGTFDPAWGQSGTYIYAKNNVMELHSGTNLEIDIFNSAHPLPQGEAESSLVLEEGTPDDAFGGLDFWGKDDENYTLFAVDPTKGNFALLTDAAGKSARLIDWTHSDLIQTGVGKSNRIGVRLSADRAILLINGQQVGEFATPPTVPGNLIGLDSTGGANGPGHFGFTHLVVTAGAPPAEAATSTAPAPALPAQISASPAPAPAPPGPAAAPGAPPVAPFNANASPAPTAGAADVSPPPARAPGPNEQLVLSDDFSTYAPAWGKADTQFNVQGGRLVAQLSGKGFADRLNGAFRYYNADISFAGRVVNGPPQSGVEATFWFQDNQHYDYLYINATGAFAVYNLSGTAVTPVVPEQTSPAVHTGLGQWNTVELSLAGNAATLLINGTSVAQFAGAPSPGWAFGLVGNGYGPGPSTIEFANLRVTVPSPVQVTRGWTDILQGAAKTALPGTTLADDFNSFDPNWDMPAGLLTVENGVLMATASGGQAAGMVNKQYLFGQAEATVTTELSETAQNDTFATLLFWANEDLSDVYQLSVSAQGYYRLMHHTGAQNTDLTGWQGTAAIRQGVGQPNSFGVSTTATGGTIVINGQSVTQFTATPPAGGGYFGLSMVSSKAGPSTWVFSKFRVSAGPGA